MSGSRRTRRLAWFTMAVALVVSCFVLAQPASLAAVRAQVAAEFSDVPSISTASLARALAGPRARRPLVLDARGRAEYAVSHLPGAVWIDPDARALPGSVDPAGRAVVVYCSVGVRSGHLGRRLRGAGVSGVKNLDGGIFLWAIEGRPLVSRGGAATRVVHPYDEVWGRLVPEALRAPPPRAR